MDRTFSYGDEDFIFHYSRTVCAEKNDFTRHAHDKYELYVFFQGKGTFKVEGSEYVLSPGDILLMRPSEWHYIDLDPSVPYERLALHFREDLFAGSGYAGLTDAFTCRPAGIGNRYRIDAAGHGIRRALIDEIRKERPNERQRLFGFLAALLCDIADEAGTSIPEDAENETLPRQIISYISEHISSPQLTLGAVCSHFYISKPHFCRIFKSATGSTFSHYVSVKRLTAARQFLRSGVRPSEAAVRSGYNDYSAFYRAYTRTFGTSPKSEFIRK